MAWTADCIMQPGPSAASSDASCAQLCRGESGSHVQVAGASLAGNDHSLSSSTLIGCVSGLFGRSRPGTGSSLCGSVGDRSSMDETIHRSCRAFENLAAAAPGRDSSTRMEAWLRRVPRSWSHTRGTAGNSCLGVHAGQLRAGYEGYDGPTPTHHARENNAHGRFAPCGDDQHRERCGKFRARRIAMGPRSDDVGPRHHVRTIG